MSAKENWETLKFEDIFTVYIVKNRSDGGR